MAKTKRELIRAGVNEQIKFKHVLSVNYLKSRPKLKTHDPNLIFSEFKSIMEKKKWIRVTARKLNGKAWTTHPYKSIFDEGGATFYINPAMKHEDWAIQLIKQHNSKAKPEDKISIEKEARPGDTRIVLYQQVEQHITNLVALNQERELTVDDVLKGLTAARAKFVADKKTSDTLPSQFHDGVFLKRLIDGLRLDQRDFPPTTAGEVKLSKGVITALEVDKKTKISLKYLERYISGILTVYKNKPQ